MRAGAAAVDITPRELPVIVNGGFLTREVKVVADRLHSRAIVLDDGNETVAIAVVDSCMVPTRVCDEAKRLASAKTMNLSLANGAEGYIPPPEQHHLGGYNTWPANCQRPMAARGKCSSAAAATASPTSKGGSMRRRS